MCNIAQEKNALESCSLYLHIPFCISKCSYCDFFSRPCRAPDKEKTPVPDLYIEALCREINSRLACYKVKRLDTVYIGGGTPSLLTGEQLTKLFNCLKKTSYDKSPLLSESSEITIEVNPDDLSLQFLQTLEECGVNRISCGIQSMNEEALKKACRRADYKTNCKALKLLRDFWKGELSLDLISGLPGDGETELIHSLEELCKAEPDHISLYSLTIEENTPFGKALSSGSLDYDFDAADRLWIKGRDFLEAQGFEWYEVSNFCKKGKECRHNLSYWTHKDYIGCGSGATGSIYKKDGSGIRWTGSSDIEKYIEYWSSADDISVKERVLRAPQLLEEIDQSVSEFEFFMMGLRKIKGISEAEFRKVFNKALPEKFLELYAVWESRGLCTKAEGECGRYAMSREGMLFLNRFLEELC